MRAEQMPDVARDYLRRLRASSRWLPEPERGELLADIEAHLADGLAQCGSSEAAVRNLVDSLGSPDDVAAAAFPARPRPRLSFRDTVTPLMLLGGGMVGPPVVWLVGVVLLWTSPSWPSSKKWLATLVWPGGVAVPIAIGVVAILVGHVSAWIALPLMVAAVVPPVVVAIDLYRTAQP